MLVHAGITELAGKREHHCLWPSIVGPDLQDDGHILVLALEVLILSCQSNAAGGCSAGQREGRAAAVPGAGRLGSHLAEDGLSQRNPRAFCKSIDLVQV